MYVCMYVFMYAGQKCPGRACDWATYYLPGSWSLYAISYIAMGEPPLPYTTSSHAKKVVDNGKSNVTVAEYPQDVLLIRSNFIVHDFLTRTSYISLGSYIYLR